MHRYCSRDELIWCVCWCMRLDGGLLPRSCRERTGHAEFTWPAQNAVIGLAPHPTLSEAALAGRDRREYGKATQ